MAGIFLQKHLTVLYMLPKNNIPLKLILIKHEWLCDGYITQPCSNKLRTHPPRGSPAQNNHVPTE